MVAERLADDKFRLVIMTAGVALIIVLLLELIDDLAWRVDRLETIAAHKDAANGE